ncbi:Tnks [Symbiodinium sp. CCMP2592]|nr:Tnks [Symbiodinium sp. CCMP2592]
MAISKNKRNRRRRRIQAEAEVCISETKSEVCGNSETAKDDTEERTLDGVDVGQLQEELRQARGDLLLLRKSNQGLSRQLSQVRSSNTALEMKLHEQTRMLEKELEFKKALVDGLRQVGTLTGTEASGRYEKVACWEYLETDRDSWRRYLPDAEQSIEEARLDKLPELTIRSSGFRYLINLSTMTQKNVETSEMRAIRRREILLHADAMLKMTTETLQHLRGENKQLNSVLREKADEIERLEDDVRALQKRIRELNGEIDNLHATHERTAECLASAENTARKLKVRHAELQSEHASMKTNMEKLHSALTQRHYKTVLSQLPPKPQDESARQFFRSLDVDDPKHLALLEQFQSSMVSHRLRLGSDLWCDPAKVSVTRIEELVHPSNQMLYEAARRIRASEDTTCGCTPIAGISAFKCEVQPGWVDMNEYLLYHGTTLCNTEQIVARGFDAQRGGESTGAMFGRGVYFAENASKSDLYTTCHLCKGIGNRDFRKCAHARGERCILVARVLLGESKPVKNSADAGGKDQIRAPQRDDGTSYDSITALTKAEGGLVDHKEFVVFKDRQTLASFRIFYRHDSSCSCNGCQHRRSSS